MIYILHLETSTKVCSVALSCDGKQIAIKEDLSNEYSHAENLTIYIQEVLLQSSISLKELSAVSVASGPGSYTGLRIGVSTAKGLCYALEIPLIAVDSLISLATIANEKHVGMNLCALIDARRMEEFNGFYSSDLKSLKAVSADIITEDSYKEFEPFIYFGDGAIKLEEIWMDRNCTIDKTIYSSAMGQISLAFEKFNKKQFEDVAYFEPFYLKDFMGLKKNN